MEFLAPYRIKCISNEIHVFTDSSAVALRADMDSYSACLPSLVFSVREAT